MHQHDTEIIKYIFDPMPSQRPQTSSAILKEVVTMHRIVGKALEKLSLAEETDADLELHLRRSHARTIEKFFTTLATVHELTEIVSEATPTLMLKGNSAFLLTNDPTNIRESFDCDLLVEDVTAFWEIIGSIAGIEFHSTNDLDLHEVGGFIYKGVEFDIQSSAQVIARSYSADLSRRSQILDRNQFRQISYDDLSEGSLISLIGNCQICAPTQAAVMSITHAYRDYVKYSSMNSRRKSPIRAGDLWDIACFVRHPAFCQQKFCSLVQRYGIFEQCYFISRLLTTYIFVPELQCILDSSFPAPNNDTKAYLSDRLLFNSYWHSFGGNALVPDSRSSDISLPSVISIELPPNGLPVEVAPDQYGLILTSDEPGKTTSFTLSLSSDSERLRLRLCPRWSGMTYGKRIHIDFHGTILEWNQRYAMSPYFASNGKLIKKDILCSWDMRDDGTHDIVLKKIDVDPHVPLQIIVAVGEFDSIPRLNNITAIRIMQIE